MTNKKLRILVIVIVIIVLVAGAVALIKKKKNKLANAPVYGLSPTIVHVAEAKAGDLDIDLSYLAVVESFQKADISSRVAASVVSVAVNEGDRVNAGDLLVSLNAKDLFADIDSISAQIAQTEAELAANHSTAVALGKSAKFWDREAGRDMALAEDGAIAEAQAEATVNRADEIAGQRDAANRKSTAISRTVDVLVHKKIQLEAQLDYYQLVAPFNGVVTRRMVDPGSLASSGKPLITVEEKDRLILAFDVPQPDLARIVKGLPVFFSMDGQTKTASLSHMYPSLKESRMLRAEVFIEGPDTSALIIGEYVPVTIRIKNIKDKILLPAECIVLGENPYVYLVQEGHIRHHAITILGNNGKITAIDGIDPGSQVVVNTFLGWARLADGMPVEVAE
ncbi:MAG: efflux RND transporter periplasmic adaptor subunit [Desulfobacteraceae bacterium]|nr:efflux RND transporter periplasmic adaptor subunit [Desulfobacteraceae bacterium]